MRKLILKLSLSIDGFCAGPNGEVEWVFPTLDPGAQAWIVETLRRAGAHLMGARTFADMVAHWPTSTEPYAAPMNEIPKVVFSRSLDPASLPATQGLSPHAHTWAEARVASGDLVEEIARLKAEPGRDLLAHGGAAFARALIAHNLVDEYRLLFHPVVLGRGLAVFDALAAPRKMRLVDVTEFEAGAVAKVYRPR